MRKFCANRYEYLWEDGVRFRRATKLPAPEYVDTLMNWVQSILDDEAIFPNKIGRYLEVFFHCYDGFPSSIGVPFPRTFRETVRTIFRRLFRVYGHIYSSHFDQICALGIEGLSLFCVDCYLSSVAYSVVNQHISIPATDIFFCL